MTPMVKTLDYGAEDCGFETWPWSNFFLQTIGFLVLDLPETIKTNFKMQKF